MSRAQDLMSRYRGWRIQHDIYAPGVLAELRHMRWSLHEYAAWEGSKEELRAMIGSRTPFVRLDVSGATECPPLRAVERLCERHGRLQGAIASMYTTLGDTDGWGCWDVGHWRFEARHALEREMPWLGES